MASHNDHVADFKTANSQPAGLAIAARALLAAIVQPRRPIGASPPRAAHMLNKSIELARIRCLPKCLRHPTPVRRLSQAPQLAPDGYGREPECLELPHAMCARMRDCAR